MTNKCQWSFHPGTHRIGGRVGPTASVCDAEERKLAEVGEETGEVTAERR
jgi:hypothetical protein